MIRLRVSTIEEYRRVIVHGGDEQELIARLMRGQWTDGPSNWKMRAGTAWHQALAGQEYSTSEINFDSVIIDQCRAYVGPGLCEVTGERAFVTTYSCCNNPWHGFTAEAVAIEGTADHIRGLVVQDHKTKFDLPDIGDYERSLQWRFYLLIHEAQVFRYNLFHFKEPDKSGYMELKDIVSCRFWRYPGMESDCHEWLARFMDWASSKHLMRWLERDARERIAA